MKVKITFLACFICLRIVFFSQSVNPHSKTQGPVIFDGNQAIVTSYTATACGLNYVHASNMLFARTGNNFTGSVLQPAVFGISGIPACAIIEKAFLYVGTSGASVSINASITNPFSANSNFLMTLIGSGPDKNWGFAGSYSYRADVTPIIAGNGNYIISGIPTSTSNTADDANGATLLVIFSDRSQTFSGSIVIADGNFVNANAAGSVNTTITGFSVCGTPSLTTNFMLVDDLQMYDSTFISLNSAVTNYTQLPSADLPWKFINDAGTAATIGQSTADFSLTNTADTVGLLMVGMYFRNDCLTCPVTLNVSAVSTPSCLATATVNTSGGVGPYTYTWSGTAQTTQDVTGLSAGVYTVNVSDNLGCIAGTATLDVATPALPIGVNNATICVGYGAGLGAGAALSYNWSPSASLDVSNAQNVIASPLSTTIYTVNFVDALGCAGTSTAEVLVTFTQAIVINNSTLCANQSINLSTNGFSSDFYLWQGPNGYTSMVQTPVISNATTLMSGTYNLSVTSIPGCTSTAASVVNVFPLPTPTITSNSPICENSNLDFFGASGGGVTFYWSGPNGFLSANQNPVILNAGLPANGIFNFTSTFANGCANTVTFNAVVLPLPIPSIISNSNVCIGRPLFLNGNGGATYQWTGPNAFTSTLQNTSIPAVSLASNGVYTMVVTAGNNCQAAATLTLAALLNPTVSATGTTVCFGAPATLTANGGGFFQWLGPGGYNTSPTVGITYVPVVNNLSSGIYTVILISALNSCSANATTTLATIPLPNVSATGTNVCLNSPGTLTVSGGVSYAWAGPNGYTALGANAVVPVANALSTGIYMATVTAANSCTGAVSASLGVLPLPNVTATGTLLCLNEPFTLLAGGASTYTWTGPSGYFANGANAYIPFVNNLSAGLYTVFGRAANSCTGIATAVVATMSLPLIVTTGSVVCLNQPAILKATGGLANSTGYKWTGPGGYTSYAQNAVIAQANNASVQIYTVVGTAPNSCTNVNVASLVTIPLPTVSATATTVCYGSPFTIFANGASTYTWSGPNSANTSGSASNYLAVVDSLSSGIYSIVGMATTGCTNNATTIINTIPLPKITATGTTVCIFQPATLLAGGGLLTGYTWAGPAGFTSSLQAAYVASAINASVQTYTVIGTGINGCTNVATTTLNTFPLPEPAYTATTNVCLGDYVTLKAYGAKTYTWTGPRNYFLTNPTASFPAFNLTLSGNYTLNVLDSLGCKNFTTAAVTVNRPPQGYLKSDNKGNYCVPFCSDFNFKRTSPLPIVNTTWIFNENTATGDNFKYCTTKAATDKLTGIFTDVLGCASTYTFALISHPTPTAAFSYAADKPVETIDEVVFNDRSSGEQITNYNWFFIETDKFISTDKNMSLIFENAGQYQIALTVGNTWGCMDTVVRSVMVDPDVKLFVPDAFTPNNDGMNEKFQPKGTGIIKYTFEIYTRWGDKVFSTSNFETGWDGKLNGNHCDNDIYIWKIFATDIKNQRHDMTGRVALVR